LLDGGEGLVVGVGGGGQGGGGQGSGDRGRETRDREQGTIR
jgi:hypothetical protein